MIGGDPPGAPFIERYDLLSSTKDRFEADRGTLAHASRP